MTGPNISEPSVSVWTVAYRAHGDFASGQRKIKAPARAWDLLGMRREEAA